MATKFGSIEFQTYKSGLAPSAHMIAWTDNDDEVQKWRWCLTMNDDGTWQWAPGPPDWVSIPPEITESISEMVKNRVQESGISVTKLSV